MEPSACDTTEAEFPSPTGMLGRKVTSGRALGSEQRVGTGSLSHREAIRVRHKAPIPIRVVAGIRATLDESREPATRKRCTPIAALTSALCHEGRWETRLV